MFGATEVLKMTCVAPPDTGGLHESAVFFFFPQAQYSLSRKLARCEEHCTYERDERERILQGTYNVHFSNAIAEEAAPAFRIF